MPTNELPQRRVLPGMTAPPVADTVDLVDVARTVRRQWRALAICVAGGAALAGLVLLLAPRSFTGVSSVVVRAADPAGSILSRIGGGGGNGNGSSAADMGLGNLIAGSMKSPLETELQILQSRTVLGAVVDSLRLQARVRAPRGVAPAAIVASIDAPGSFKPKKYTFTRTAPGTYEVSGRGFRGTAVAGSVVQLPVARVVLRDSLPDEFRIQIYDREDAVTRADRAVGVKKLGGEVVRISFAAADSLTAAAATNTLVDNYLRLRKTTDRGKTVERVDFLEAQVDTVARDLAAAESALRMHQERSGVIDPEVVGELRLEEATELRQQHGKLQVEEGALAQLVAQVREGRLTPRQLAAYPSFLASNGINDFLRQLSALETERTRLLERRLETDPEVVAIDQAVEGVEAQLLPLATSYAASIRRQRTDVEQQLASIQSVLNGFPAAAQATVRLQRDVTRLGQFHTALLAQLVEARLAALSEGGDVLRLDVAQTPKKVSFPQPGLTMATGLGGGMILGLVVALMIGTMGRYVEDPRLIERAAGVPALPLHAGVPLLMTGRAAATAMLLVPLDAGTSTREAAERLAQTSLARGKQTTILDLTGEAVPPGASGGLPDAGVTATIARLEQEFETVIVRLPGFGTDATAAALNETRPVYIVASDGRVDRANLIGVVETLRRLDVPCAGVVLNGRELSQTNGRRWI